MKDFADYARKQQVVRQVCNLMDLYRSVYAQCKLIQEVHRSNDPTLKSAIDALFTQDEWKTLKQMTDKVDTLIADWEKNYNSVIQQQ